MESGALGEHVLTHSPAFNFLCFLGTLILFSGKLPAVTNLFLNKPNPGSGEARQGLSHSLPRGHHTSGWPPGSGPEPRPGLGLPHPKRPLILGPRVTPLLHRCLVPTPDVWCPLVNVTHWACRAHRMLRELVCPKHGKVSGMELAVS